MNGGRSGTLYVVATPIGNLEDLSDRVREIVRKTQYKRRLPLIAKVSFRSIDRDFRYSRDWGR